MFGINVEEIMALVKKNAETIKELNKNAVKLTETVDKLIKVVDKLQEIERKRYMREVDPHP